MKVTIKFFASLRESLKISQESVDVPAGIATVADLRQHLRARGDLWAEVLAENKAIRMALNHEMVDGDVALVDQAEVAFFPPVTGG
ncbi:MAG: molybdopterin converting factor, subunit 1 [Pseudomonadota bacterium]|jgi:molybdopterin synthase sulfur carrier subunit